MQKSEDVVIPMQQSFNLDYYVGNSEILENVKKISSLPIFSDVVMNFLEEFSKIILHDKAGREYPDVMTLGFWCRKAHLHELKSDYRHLENKLVQGRGIVFHIAPSNVAVNFAYSLVVGLLSGNVNIVRLPSNEFSQVDIICSALNKAIITIPDMAKYILLVKYGHDREINDYFSEICDTRIIWGGDNTIAEIRKSPLHARATEITFADRYSIAVIDSNTYLSLEDKEKVASDFYNDTYLTDQNACTSPKLVVWLGNNKLEAKKIFWNNLYELVKKKYAIQPIQAVDKLTNTYLISANSDAHISYQKDNLLNVVNVKELSNKLLSFVGNSGFFIEYEANQISEILSIVTERLQTVGYIGIDKNIWNDFIKKYCPAGIDRIVPIGHTMDFSLIWDGYDLITGLSRCKTCV